MLNNKRVATVILVIASIGLGLSYPYHNTFWGGLVASGFSAAMIGGLADWYAVTALFRKPFGIAWRTAVIPRNRNKLEDALVQMIVYDILKPLHLNKFMRELDFAQILLKSLGENEREKILQTVIIAYFQKTIAVGATDIQQFIKNLNRCELSAVNAADFMQDFIEHCIKAGLVDQGLDVLSSEGVQFIQQPRVKREIIKLIIAVRRNYEQDMINRQIYNKAALLYSGLSIRTLAQAIQSALITNIAQIKIADDPLRRQLKQRIQDIAVNMAPDNLVSLALKELIVGWFEQVNIVSTVEKLGDRSEFQDFTRGAWDALIMDLRSDTTKQKKINVWIKRHLFLSRHSYQAYLAKLVRDKLSRFSDEQWSHFIESRVGHDLQMIRMNGSLVGGIAGMLLYILNKIISVGIANVL